MTADEIIEKIKALSESDRAEVRSFVRSLKADSAQSGLEMKDAPASVAVNYMDSETFAAAKTRVFQQHADLLEKLSR